MARFARVEVFASDEVAIVHVLNRTVRLCFLLGNDPISGKNFDHRRQWMVSELGHIAKGFGIDLLGFAILSNYFHLLSQKISKQANEDDKEVGKFWIGS